LFHESLLIQLRTSSLLRLIRHEAELGRAAEQEVFASHFFPHQLLPKLDKHRVTFTSLLDFFIRSFFYEYQFKKLLSSTSEN
jgi:hypothetical protein